MKRTFSPLQSRLAAGRVSGIPRPYVPRQAKPQVTEFSSLSKDPLPKEQRELADLQERAGAQPRNREVLESFTAKAAKYSIETGVSRDGRVMTPLEPWTCPVPGGTRLYYEVMFGEKPSQLDDFSDDQLTAVKWMRDEELISVGEDGSLLPLSDGKSADRRAYPGVPGPDSCRKVNGAHTCVSRGKRCASLGDYLRDHARNLVMAALVNLSAGRPVHKMSRRRKGRLERADGLEITAAMLCKEVNAIKARRPDLDGYRFLSLTRCREILRDLILGGTVEERQGCRPIRQNRSWRTLPRVISRLAAGTTDRLGRSVSPPLEAAA